MSASADAKLFQRHKAADLRMDLISDKKDKGWVRKKATLKKIIANATMGNDMSSLFNEVVDCMNIQVLEIKKMVCEYSIRAGKTGQPRTKPYLGELIYFPRCSSSSQTYTLSTTDEQRRIYLATLSLASSLTAMTAIPSSGAWPSVRCRTFQCQ